MSCCFSGGISTVGASGAASSASFARISYRAGSRAPCIFAYVIDDQDVDVIDRQSRQVPAGQVQHPLVPDRFFLKVRQFGAAAEESIGDAVPNAELGIHSWIIS
jgi:hypothetical protein